MGHEVTIGGERLGSGKRSKAYLHHYERSTHNLSYVWRSTMAAGTLVPFMTEVALPGDTFDIELDVDMLSHPTIGPLFGSYKIQLDTFLIPIRLYQGKLHMNKLDIGRDMSKIMLPQIELSAKGIVTAGPIDNQQINPSCIFSYLGIRGLGASHIDFTNETKRWFNAIPYLGYWDIYKQYYANKQEEIGAVIHKSPDLPALTISAATLVNGNPTPIVLELSAAPAAYINGTLDDNSSIVISQVLAIDPQVTVENINLYVQEFEAGGLNVPKILKAVDVFSQWTFGSTTIVGSVPTPKGKVFRGWGGIAYVPSATVTTDDQEPKIVTFPLKNIDDAREAILVWTNQPGPFMIGGPGGLATAPYGLPLTRGAQAPFIRSMEYNQEGLALKTYNSDLFNNWISTEWIDGVDGISAITAVDTSGGSFTIDELNMSRKIYDMLNRIAISGGTYDDWLDAVYTHERTRGAENPMYLGGLITNLVFQEVVSNSRSADQPLGTLAGRGKIGNKRKGGQVVAKVDEPSYIMGIISLTPNVDYSQGNKWDVNLQTMNDFHKPALDEIGFQDLITDQMAWWDTNIDLTTNPTTLGFISAGKQPAWLNYMTNVNVVRGNFADQQSQMFMTLNRRYEANFGAGAVTLKDLTTYIDPTKFNHIFADTRRDAQNFWAQIAVNITARRKMSAKLMPNL